MDGPINQAEPTSPIEWASRESPGTGIHSPTAVRKAPSQPVIREEEKESDDPEKEELRRLHLAPPPTDDKRTSIQSPDDGATAYRDVKRQGPHQFASEPVIIAEPAKHSFGDEFPGGHEEGAITLPHYQISEPILPSHQHEALAERQLEQSLPSEPASKVQSTVSPGLLNPMAHLLPGSTLQDSPDPLTPGEDRKLRSLEDIRTSSSPSQPLEQQSHAEQSDQSGSKGDSSGSSIASAPAIMGRGYKPLSPSTPVMVSGTWDERRKGTSRWTTEHSIEEETEGAEDVLQFPHGSTQSLPPENLLAPVKEAGEPSQPRRIDVPATPLAFPHLDTPDIHPEPPGTGSTGNPVEAKATWEAPVATEGREEGWGTPFKVKWIRTDPLPFHRTRHLRNPWNHDVNMHLYSCFCHWLIS